MFGKSDYLRIYFSLTVKVALGLLSSCCGRSDEAAGEEGCAHGRTPPPGQQLLRLFAGQRQELGQSSSSRVFS